MTHQGINVPINLRVVCSMITIVAISCSDKSASPSESEPTREQVWCSRYVLASGFQSAVDFAFILATKADNLKAKNGMEAFCAAKLFEYWIAIESEPAFKILNKNENGVVKNLETRMKLTYHKLQLSDEEKKFPLGFRDLIQQLDGSKSLSDSGISVFNAYFPDPSIKSISDYEKLVKSFQLWVQRTE